MEPLQRASDALCEHRDGASRGGGGQHPLSRPLPGGPGAVCNHVPGEHDGGGGAPPLPKAGLPALAINERSVPRILESRPIAPPGRGRQGRVPRPRGSGRRRRNDPARPASVKPG